MGGTGSLQHSDAVDDEFVSATEELGSLSAEQHSAHENFEVFKHAADAGVNGQVQSDGVLVWVNEKVSVLGCVVNSVVDVKGCHVGVANPRTMDIGFIGDN